MHIFKLRNADDEDNINTNSINKVKRLKVLYSYLTAIAIWDHTVLPFTLHKWTHPALTTATVSYSHSKKVY